MNEFVEGSWFHHITVRAAGIAARQVGLVVRRGEDDDGDRSEASIGPEPLQKVAAIPSAKLEIEEDKGGRGSWRGLFARGTRGLRRPSFDVRSRAHTSRLARRVLEGAFGMVNRSVLQKMQRSFRVMLGIEGNIVAGSRQCEAKEFALAGAVFDQEDGGVRHHI